MHILFLSDNFPPETNAPATRTYEHAVHWVKNGHKVTVITCAPNFPEGRVFEGYKNCWYSHQLMDGINVVRVKSYITSNEGFFKRILDFLSFMVSGAFAGLFQKNPDVVIATSPQFFTAIGGCFLAKIRRKPFVFELRDIWPASITAVGAMKKTFLIKILERIEIFLYKQADLIVSVTNSFKSDLIGRGIESDKIAVVLNGVDLSKYKPSNVKDLELSEQYGLRGKFVVGYLGTHGLAHSLENVILAAETLREMKDVVFLFVGDGAAKNKIQKYSERKGLSNVIFLNRQPKELMPRFWSLCDISLAHLKNTELFKTVIPSKIFESMGMGVPVVLSCPPGEATELIEKTRSGICVPPESPTSLASAIIFLASEKEKLIELRNNCIRFSREYSRESMARKMIYDLNLMMKKGNLNKK